MYTIINCAKDGCESGGDEISVQIKVGPNSEFREIGRITGRAKDTQWTQDTFNFEVQQNIFYVEIKIY